MDNVRKLLCREVDSCELTELFLYMTCRRIGSLDSIFYTSGLCDLTPVFIKASAESFRRVTLQFQLKNK